MFSRLATTLADVPAHAWLAVAAVLVVARIARRFGMWAYALFAFPGTLAHELSHYAVARLLFADPRLPRLWPERTATGWRLGSVAFRAPWWRAAPIALAPMLLAPAALAWIAGTLVDAALPSRADLRIAMPMLALLALVLVAVGAIVALR